jgi:hypothetical protein
MDKIKTMDTKMKVALGLVGAVFSCILLICAFAVVAVLISDDDDDNGTTAAQSTATTVEQASAPEPEPTATEPVPTATPVTDMEYLAFTQSASAEMVDSLGTFVGLMEDPTFEPEWEESLRGVLATWRQQLQQTEALTPPDALEPTYAEFLLAMQNYSLAADALDDMLENQTQESVDRAVNYMNIGNEHMDRSNNLLDEYTPGS